jgi:hypothetical protein
MAESYEIYMLKEEVLDLVGDVISQEYIAYFGYCEIYEVKLRFDSKKDMVMTVNNPAKFIEKLKPHLVEDHLNNLMKIGYEVDGQKLCISGC